MTFVQVFFFALYYGFLWAILGTGFFLLFAVPAINEKDPEDVSNARLAGYFFLLFVGGPYIWYLTTGEYLRVNSKPEQPPS